MAKLQFKDEFLIEYDDKTFTGEFLSLNRKQIKAFEKKYKDNETSEDDAIFKERLQTSIISDDKKEIMAIGAEYNYKIIFETIIEDIAEKKAKN